MKKKILLVDESLTVQKVVSLTLDRAKFQLVFAKNKGEVVKHVVEGPPDLILISDQVPEINVPSFPKELETWVGGVRPLAPVILVTGQDIKEQKHYAAVLKKPFAPQALLAIVSEFTRDRAPTESETEAAGFGASEDVEEQRLQKIFNETFADEATLVKETYKAEHDSEEPTLLNRSPSARPEAASNLNWGKSDDLWSAGGERTVPGSNTPASSSAPLWGGTAATKAPPDDETLKAELSDNKLSEVVDRMLEKMLPPIVERLVQERLDKLLHEQEQFVELKP